MPRHLISDAHEWINEIPTVPIYYLANPQPRERAWNNQRGKKTLVRYIMLYNQHQPCPKYTITTIILTSFLSLSLFLLLVELDSSPTL